MAWITVALCMLVADLGVIGIVSPRALLRVARHFQSPAGLYAAAAFRVLLGYTLLRSSATSRAPRAIRAVGAVVLLSGLLTPAFGLERFHAVLEWWSTLGMPVMRLWAGFALAFGFLAAYAVVPRPRTGAAPRGPSSPPE